MAQPRKYRKRFTDIKWSTVNKNRSFQPTSPENLPAHDAEVVTMSAGRSQGIAVVYQRGFIILSYNTGICVHLLARASTARGSTKFTGLLMQMTAVVFQAGLHKISYR